MSKVKKHADLSASSSSRWLNCPGSIKAEREYIEIHGQSTSEFAEEGSAAHALLEVCLSKSKKPESFLGKRVYKKIKADQAMVDAVNETMEYVDKFRTEKTIPIYESRVSLLKWIKDGFGTVDIVLVNDDEIHVIDFKYGKGVLVEAEENTQCMLYALGAIEEFEFLIDVKIVHLHIAQPRRESFSSWTITRDALNEFGKDVIEKAKLAIASDAKRIPGETQCRWCLVRNDCNEVYKMAAETIPGEFEDLSEVDVHALTDEQLVKIVSNKKQIETFLKSVDDRLVTEFTMGKKITGLKLVYGRSVRKWDTDRLTDIEEEFGDTVFTKKLMGVTDAIKEHGEKNLNKFIVKSTPPQYVVPVTDSRKEVEIKS